MYNRKMKYWRNLSWIILTEVFLLSSRCEKIWNNNFSSSFQKNSSSALLYCGVLRSRSLPWQWDVDHLSFLVALPPLRTMVVKQRKLGPREQWESLSSPNHYTKQQSYGRGERGRPNNGVLDWDNLLDATGPGYVNISLWLYRKWSPLVCNPSDGSTPHIAGFWEKQPCRW